MKPRYRVASDGSVAPVPPMGGMTRRVRQQYEAGDHVRRTSAWHAPSSFPNDALYQLTTLRNRSRAAVRNDGIAKAILDKLVSNVVGTGIRPLFKADDAALRPILDAAFVRWTDESDADGLLDFYGQMAQAARTWFEAGECFVRFRFRRPEDGLFVPFQIQVLEPEFCPHDYTEPQRNGNRVRAGIEFDAIGRRVAYHFHTSRPGDLQDIDPAQLRRVPAESVVHLYDPQRAGQLRGMPQLTQALVELYEIKKMKDAVLLRQQLSNMLVGFVKRSPMMADAAIDPFTGAAPDTSFGDKPLVTWEPGTFQELEDGQELEFSEPPDPAATFKDYLRGAYASACSSAGVPYELVTGDMSGLNDRVVRVILNEFAQRVEAWQHQILVYQLCRRVNAAWLDQAVLVGAVPIDRTAYFRDRYAFQAAKFTPPRRRYLHPVQDVDAQIRAILAGFTSRAAVVNEWGEDAETVDAEQAVDNARADQLRLRYSSDGRFVNSSATPTAGAAESQDEPARDTA